MGFNPDAYLTGSTSGGFNPDAYLGITPPEQSLKDKAIGAIKNKAIDFATDVAGPKNLYNTYGQSLPTRGAIIGGSVGGVPGATVGGGLGQIAKNMMGIGVGDPNAPTTPGAAAIPAIGQALASGVMESPKILEGIPGVNQINQYASKISSKAGSGLANLMQAMTGAKADVLKQAAKQSISETYAPKGLGLTGGMGEAQNIFGKAAESAGAGGRPPLKQVIDPALSTARKVALDVGKKLETGVDISAGEALQARQAIDRIYNATSLLDRSTRAHLADLRSAFDDVMAGKSGALKEASTLYRKAIVKDTLTNLFKITKQGQISAVAPMVATLAASAGLGSGHKGETGLGALGYLAASSPMIAGLGATAGGSAARGLQTLGQNPAVRQALLGILQKLMAKKNGQ